MIYQPDKQNISLCEALSIRPGITAVIGGGGKTTLIKSLAEELTGHKTVPSAASGKPGASALPSVLLCTSTHMWPSDEYPCVETAPDEASYRILEKLRRAFSESPIVSAGTLEKSTGKYTAPSVSFKELLSIADCCLVEADGSKGLPFKAHASYEPVIPEGTSRTVLVTGASAFCKPVQEAVHRPEIFLHKVNALPDSALRASFGTFGLAEEPACGPGGSYAKETDSAFTPDCLLTPELAAAFINLEGLADICLLTQTDLLCEESAPDLIKRFGEKLSIPLLTASLVRRPLA